MIDFLKIALRNKQPLDKFHTRVAILAPLSIKGIWSDILHKRVINVGLCQYFLHGYWWATSCFLRKEQKSETANLLRKVNNSHNSFHLWISFSKLFSGISRSSFMLLKIWIKRFSQSFSTKYIINITPKKYFWFAKLSNKSGENNTKNVYSNNFYINSYVRPTAR